MELEVQVAMSVPWRNRLVVGKWLLMLLLTLPLSAIAPAALAERAVAPNNFSKQPGMITTEQAANIVRRESGGRVLSIKPVDKGGERGYDVRVLIDGKRVKQYYVDWKGRTSSR